MAGDIRSPYKAIRNEIIMEGCVVWWCVAFKNPPPPRFTFTLRDVVDDNDLDGKILMAI